MNDAKLEAAARRAVSESPSGYFLLVAPTQNEESVSLSTVFSVLTHAWKLLLAAATGGALIAAVIALLMHNIYRAETLIAPALESGGKGGLGGELGGLASLAGVDLAANNPRAELFYATLISRDFARSFIASENLLPILFESSWDPATGRWRADKKPPTLEDGVKYFQKRVCTILQDRKTGMVTLTIDWYSAQLAARWANRMVEMINDRLRAEAIRKADLSIEYLNKELAKANAIETKQDIYGMIRDQLSDAMQANVQRDYAFQIIDPAVPPQLKHGPLRLIMVLVGGFVGGFLGAIFVFIRRSVRASRSSPAPVDIPG
jgi:uncharacterized protein involved in exopolysaccharide biosynthesis